MKILVTGGTGYIGSHTVVKLMENGHDVVIIDNLSNSKIEVVDYIEKITGRKPEFHKIDMCDYLLMEELFKNNHFDSVIHFAGLKAVGESVMMPLEYYRNNLFGSINLFNLMKKYNVKKIVFSSSATVYGKPLTVPIKEDFPLTTTNPYGATKLMIEQVLKDLYVSDNSFDIVILRYFNPVGAHKSGLIGENPNGIPNNLVPYIVKVLNGELPYLRVYGSDYDTFDGTGVRDYIHIDDLAEGHILALKKMDEHVGLKIYNLGTGKGYSVLDMVKVFEKVTKQELPYKMMDRRPGDIAECYADPSLAKEELGFVAKQDLESMARDAYYFEQKNHPKK